MFGRLNIYIQKRVCGGVIIITFSSVVAEMICCNTILVGMMALCIDMVMFLPAAMLR